MRLSLKYLLIAISVILSVPAVRSAEYSSSYDFLNITSSVRIYGLGGINISTVEDNLEVADQNPALLGPEMGGWIDVNYMRYLGESNFAGVKYGQGFNEYGAWLASVQYYGYGSVDEIDAAGNVIGSFSPKDITASGTFSYDIFKNIRIGATVKFIYSSYAEFTALAVGADLGINYFNPDNDFSFSVVGANLGGQVKKFGDRTEKLPTDLRAGFTWGFRNLPLRISVTGWNLTRWGGAYNAFMKHVVLGLDFVPSSKFYLSLGYNYKVRSDMSSYNRNIFSGFTLGTGISASRFNVGVAIAQPHSGALTFMINLGVKLSDIIR